MEHGNMNILYSIIQIMTCTLLNTHSDYTCTHRHSEIDIEKVLEFLIDNIYAILVIRSSNRVLEFPWAYSVLQY